MSYKMVGISVAHRPSSAGAGFMGFYEHYESVVWTQRLVQALGDLGIASAVSPVGRLHDKIEFLNHLQVAVAIEIHFNAAASTDIAGCETLYNPNSIEGHKLAKEVHNCYAVEMGNNDRGVKEHWHRGKVGLFNYFLNKTKCPAIIVEPEFISHIRNITTKRDVATQKIAKGIANYLKSIE